jgi:hypothetical protein
MRILSKICFESLEVPGGSKNELKIHSIVMASHKITLATKPASSQQPIPAQLIFPRFFVDRSLEFWHIMPPNLGLGHNFMNHTSPLEFLVVHVLKILAGGATIHLLIVSLYRSIR